MLSAEHWICLCWTSWRFRPIFEACKSTSKGQSRSPAYSYMLFPQFAESVIWFAADITNEATEQCQFLYTSLILQAGDWTLHYWSSFLLQHDNLAIFSLTSPHLHNFSMIMLHADYVKTLAKVKVHVNPMLSFHSHSQLFQLPVNSQNGAVLDEWWNGSYVYL